MWTRNLNFGPQNPCLQAIIAFLHPLSFNEDSHKKIVTDREFIPAFTEFLSLLDNNSRLRRSVLIIISNLVLCNLTKNHVIANPQLLINILAILTSTESSVKLKFLSSQFIVNFLHKNGAGVEIIQKETAILELSAVLDSVETLRDRFKFNQLDSLQDQDDIEEGEDFEEICRGVIANIRFVLGVLSLKIR